jgi:dolichyl-diphosphooligosaccharide--protein glycosyltransferase
VGEDDAAATVELEEEIIDCPSGAADCPIDGSGSDGDGSGNESATFVPTTPVVADATAADATLVEGASA